MIRRWKALLGGKCKPSIQGILRDFRFTFGENAQLKRQRGRKGPRHRIQIERID
jgi:hypothetical protein